jgi:hypothetical protein
VTAALISRRLRRGLHRPNPSKQEQSGMTASGTMFKTHEERSPLATSADLDQAIAELINRAGLTPSRNPFFTAARAVTQVHGDSALRIAHYWREVTKTFMLTTLAGVGRMAEVAAGQAAPPHHNLAVIRTVFRVISDHLNNEMHRFKAVAPAGVAGIHYVWWDDTILRPIADRLGADRMPELPPRILALQEMMHQLCRSPLGTAVQLRVVEAITLDIVIAFKRVFTRLSIGGNKVFPSSAQLAWMNSQLQAAVVHHNDVSNHDGGMTCLADTGAKQKEMLCLAAAYTRAWNAALADFAAALE